MVVPVTASADDRPGDAEPESQRLTALTSLAPRAATACCTVACWIRAGAVRPSPVSTRMQPATRVSCRPRYRHQRSCHPCRRDRDAGGGTRAPIPSAAGSARSGSTASATSSAASSAAGSVSSGSATSGSGASLAAGGAAASPVSASPVSSMTAAADGARSGASGSTIEPPPCSRWTRTLPSPFAARASSNAASPSTGWASVYVTSWRPPAIRVTPRPAGVSSSTANTPLRPRRSASSALQSVHSRRRSS